MKGFEMAGADGVFGPATARLEGESVVVTSSSVTKPRSIRYGWNSVTDANLANGAGLPASTFQAGLKE